MASRPKARWPLALVAVFAILVLSACSETARQADPTVTVTPGRGAAAPTATPTAPAEFLGDRAMEHIKELSQTIGPRVAGSAGESDGVEYIAGELQAMGYDVEVREFSYEGDRFRAGSVTVGMQVFDSYTMTGSGGGSAEGEAVYIGIGDEAGVAGKELQGKIAIADRGGDVPFAEKLRNARAAGASGLVVANNEPGDLIGSVGEGADVPVVGVDDEAGDVLRMAAQTGETVRIDAPGTLSTSKNVLARADSGRACGVLVGGHHDTVPAAPGALDNASGSATVLELARAFAADGLDPGLCFATFGAEESGLFGSKAMAEQFQEEGALPKVMVNLDMTALGENIELIGDPDLQRKASVIAQGLQIAAAPSQLGANFGSDHQSFQEQGVPVIFLTTSELGNFHTPGDIMSSLDPAALQRCGDLAYAVVADLFAEVARG